MESLGWLDYRVAQDYMYESSFYVVPLQGIDFAGGDSSLLQAMSFGKAVVATRAPSTETYLEHGKTGLLVEPGDIEGMRQAILHLWRNPDEAIRMGKEARQHFEENHTMDKLAQRVYDVALEVYRAQRGECQEQAAADLHPGPGCADPHTDCRLDGRSDHCFTWYSGPGVL
jgi:glycosyltransferase involved in cell wall biosynthesis